MKALLAILTVLLTSLLLIPTAQAEPPASESPTFLLQEKKGREEPYEAPPGRLFNEEAYFSDDTPLRQYVNVIVINKAAKVQSLRLYTNRQLVLTTAVSTGREDYEKVGVVRGIVRRLKGKGTIQSHWRHTTRGFYPITRIEDANYRSGENGFQMPYAMFFNEHRGLAIHQVPPDLKGGEAAGEAALGRRASSGCVRVHKDVIYQIYSAVISAGRGPIPLLNTRTGQPKLDSAGKVVYDNGYRTLVVVEEY